jgi:hypothetical protein
MLLFDAVGYGLSNQNGILINRGLIKAQLHRYLQQSYGAVFLGKLVVLQLLKVFPRFTAPEVLLQCSRGLTVESCSETMSPVHTLTVYIRSR